MGTSNLGNPKTSSELLFEECLRTHGYVDWKHEAPIEGKPTTPDYRLEFEGTTYFFEVKEFETLSPGPGFRAFDPYAPLREKINQAARQFKHYKEHPCSVVLANPNWSFVGLDPWTVMGAMLGNLGVRVIAGESAEPKESIFTSKGKLFDARRGEPQNQTFSSVVVLESYPLRQKLSKINVKENEKQLGRRLSVEEVLDIDARIPDERVVRVVVYENPHARLPLSRNLFCGPYDERFGPADGEMKRISSGDGILRVEELLGKGG